MKRAVCLLVFCNLLACSAVFGAEKDKGIKIRNWNAVETVDVATLARNMESRIRQATGIRFNFRGKDIRHLKPNWYQGSLWQPKPDGKGFVDVQVMVAKKDLPAFKSITTNAQSPEVLTIYGQVLRDSERNNFVFVRLLGRNVTVDAEGNGIVTW